MQVSELEQFIERLTESIFQTRSRAGRFFG